MKIAILTPSLDHSQGTNLQAFSHAVAFAAAGHSVTLFTFDSGGELRGMPVESLNRPLLVPVWSDRWRNLFYLFPWRRLLIRPNLEQLGQFDAVLAYNYIMSWLGHYVRKAGDTVHVQVIDGMPRVFASPYEELYHWLVNRWFWQKPLTNTDLIVTETRFLAELVAGRTGISGLPVGSMTDLSLFHAGVSGKEVRDRYHLGDSPLVLCVDYVDPGHGTHILLSSFKIVRRAIPEARLMLIGKRRYRSYQKLIQRLADDSVFFIDYVPHNEIAKFYAAATVFATCCPWEEAYSHTIVEAEACGKPVVAFRQGAHEEVVKHGETGILVDRVGDAQDFASALVTLLTDPELAAGMGARAADWARCLADEGTQGVQELVRRIETLAVRRETR